MTLAPLARPEVNLTPFSAARAGRQMSAPDGRIAAIARVHSAPWATRNVADFRETGVVLVDPWRG